MCAYSSYEGRPCCGSEELLVDILRKKWKYEGFVVSDCGAINDFLPNHHNVDPDNPSAAADAVSPGIFVTLFYFIIFQKKKKK
jgi:beta-glucosidase